jgi:hypothetical protein
MPIVLYTGEGTEQSGYVYNDITGVSYEYPERYRKLVVTGEPFVYHMPGQYTGSGIIGAISPSQKPGHFVCEILDYEPFENPVPLKNEFGDAIESEPGSGKSVYYSQGVRPLSWPAFQAILGTATSFEWLSPPPGGYARPEEAKAVEKSSVKTALRWLKAEYDGEAVTEMPHNNPGFDILVGDPKKPLKYAEVKGTRSFKPVFWMSEGERRFSVANSARYLLVVVSGVDLAGVSRPTVRVRPGAIDDVAFMEPSQWRGVLSDVSVSDH